MSEEKLASTGHSRKAQMPESRINVEDMTPDRAKDVAAGVLEAANQGSTNHKDNGRGFNADDRGAKIEQDEGKAKAGAQQKSDNDQEKARVNGQKDGAGFNNAQYG